MDNKKCAKCGSEKIGSRCDGSEYCLDCGAEIIHCHVCGSYDIIYSANGTPYCLDCGTKGDDLLKGRTEKVSDEIENSGDPEDSISESVIDQEPGIIVCPYCGSDNVEETLLGIYFCNDCRNSWDQDALSKRYSKKKAENITAGHVPQEQTPVIRDIEAQVPDNEAAEREEDTNTYIKPEFSKKKTGTKKDNKPKKSTNLIFLIAITAALALTIFGGYRVNFIFYYVWIILIGIACFIGVPLLNILIPSFVINIVNTLITLLIRESRFLNLYAIVVTVLYPIIIFLIVSFIKWMIKTIRNRRSNILKS